jgi:hypothetical protein
MTFAPKTGSGGTITFGTSNLSLAITEISQFGKTKAALDGSHLGTTNQAEMYAGDLDKVDEITVTCWFNPGVNLAVTGVSETITITYPKCNAGNNAGVLAGSGFITHVGAGGLKLGELMSSQLKFQFDGTTTEATLTKEA